jgi:hypothetical protein
MFDAEALVQEVAEAPDAERALIESAVEHGAELVVRDAETPVDHPLNFLVSGTCRPFGPASEKRSGSEAASDAAIRSAQETEMVNSLYNRANERYGSRQLDARLVLSGLRRAGFGGTNA